MKSVTFLLLCISMLSLAGCYVYTKEPPPPPAVIIVPGGAVPPPAGEVGPAR